jgi:hypothetical protein
MHNFAIYIELTSWRGRCIIEIMLNYLAGKNGKIFDSPEKN